MNSPHPQAHAFVSAARASCILAPLLCLAPAFAQDEQLRISGYGNAHYMDHNGTPRIVGQRDLDDAFLQLREFSLFLDYTVSDRLTISTEIEAGSSGNVFTANYAYFEYQATDQLRLRAGKILVPFLWYNENKPNYRQTLMSQPFTASLLAPVNGTPMITHGFGWSDTGAMLAWTTDAGDRGILDVKGSVINGLGSDTQILDDNTITLDDGGMMPTIRPRDGLLQNRYSNELRDNNSNLATTLKVTYVDSELPIEIGVSWYRGAWDPEGNQDLGIYGVHLNYTEDDWMLRSEWVTAHVQQQAGLNPGGPASNISTGDYNMQAWYAELSYVPLRWEDGDDDCFIRVIARYDDVDTNDKVAFTPWDRSRVTLGTEYQFTSNSRFRLEWQRQSIHSFGNAPAPYVNAGGDDTIEMVMASVIFWF